MVKVLSVILLGLLLTFCDIDRGAEEVKKKYKTGSVTKGNPDNSYLDSCRVYCCGD